jgi:hypothetical protein
VPVSERWYWREERPGVWVPEPDDEPEVPHESEAESSVPCGPLAAYYAGVWGMFGVAAAVWMLVARSRIDLDR